jgi:ParB family chromosome partitioning protein
VAERSLAEVTRGLARVTEALTVSRARVSRLERDVSEARAGEASASSAAVTTRLRLDAAVAALAEAEASARVAVEDASASSVALVARYETLETRSAEHERALEVSERALCASKSRVAEIEAEKASLFSELVAARDAAAAAEASRSVAERERREAAACVTHLEETSADFEKRSKAALEEMEVIRASESFLRGEVVAREVRLERAREEAKAAKAEAERERVAAAAAAAEAAARLDKAEAAAYWRVRDLEDELEAERAGRRADAAKRAAGAGTVREE